MKICKKCASTDRYADGVCRPCKKARVAAYRVANPEKSKASTDAYRAANPGKRMASCAAYRISHSEKIKAGNSAYRCAHPDKVKAVTAAWQKANPDRVNAHASKRRAIKLNSTPVWANAAKIEEFYYTAQMLGMHTGETYHVDHIVPLQNKLVCGLHCEANLQILEALSNYSKGNRHWPNMP